MASGHVLVQALDSVGTSEFSELFIHVVRATARVVTNPNAKVLHFERFALVNRVQSNNFTVRFFDLLQFAEEVPEPTLGNDFIGCKDSHAVKLRVGLIGSGEVAAHDLVFHETHDSCR